MRYRIDIGECWERGRFAYVEAPDPKQALGRGKALCKPGEAVQQIVETAKRKGSVGYAIVFDSHNGFLTRGSTTSPS